MKINYLSVEGIEKSVEVECTTISCGGVQVGYMHSYDGNVSVYVEDGKCLVAVRDAKCCTQCFSNGKFDITKGIEVDVDSLDTDIEIDLDKAEVIGIGVKDINGAVAFIRNSFLNKLVIDADSIEFIEEEERAVIKSKGYTFDLSPAKVEVKTPSGKVKGSNASTGYGSRNVWCEEHTRVSLSRLWCIAKAMHYGTLPLYQLDDYVHNHKLNNGRAEALLSGFSGLNTTNYELCSVEQNVNHGKAWNKIFYTLNKKIALSVYKDAELIRLINDLEVQYKKVDGKRVEVVDPEKLNTLLDMYSK